MLWLHLLNLWLGSWQLCRCVGTVSEQVHTGVRERRARIATSKSVLQARVTSHIASTIVHLTAAKRIGVTHLVCVSLTSIATLVSRWLLLHRWKWMLLAASAWVDDLRLLFLLSCCWRLLLHKLLLHRAAIVGIGWGSLPRLLLILHLHLLEIGTWCTKIDAV